MLKQRVGSSLGKSHLFHHDTVRLWLLPKGSGWHQNCRRKKRKENQPHHPGQNDKWQAGYSEHQIVQTMEKQQPPPPKARLPRCLLPGSVLSDHPLLTDSEEILHCCCSCLENSSNTVQTPHWNKATGECCSRDLSWEARCKIYYDTVQRISEREV